MAAATPGEFELIERYFRRPVSRAILGPGDDCAVLGLPAGRQLAVSTDLLVEGRHFFADVDPAALGHKCLAVNLSDLAAAGAQPVAFTLALALPRVDPAWLQAFSAGLFALADMQGCELVGGDTTAGPLTIGITVFGEVPTGAAQTRGGARPGEELWVSGVLGDARLALALSLAERGQDPGLATPLALPLSPPLSAAQRSRLQAALERPQPRIALGLGLRGIASAAMDLSDGLAGDLQHLLARSGVGADVNVDAVPRSDTLASLPVAVQRACALSGGDDYELLFAAPAARHGDVLALGAALELPLTCIGRLSADRALRWVDGQGRALPVTWHSFDHFRPDRS